MSIDRLKIGDKYSKVDLSKIFNSKNVENIQGGYFSVKQSNSALLFVTLDKTGRPDTCRGHT